MTQMDCTICGSAHLEVLAVRGELTIFRCRTCGVTKGSLSGLMENDSAISTSPNHFSFVTDNFEALIGENVSLLNKRVSTYSRILGKSPVTWLEVGPGSGAFGQAVERSGSFWVGVEIDSAMAKRASTLGQNVIEANFANLSPATVLSSPEVSRSQGFDIVYSTQVVEHVPNPEAFMKTAFSVLRPGGLLHIDVPNHNGLTGLVRKVNKRSDGYGEIVPPHHMLAYDKHALEKLLKRSKFEIVSIATYAYNHPRFGLAHARLSPSKKFQGLWKLSGLAGLGGNLVALARKPVDDV